MSMKKTMVISIIILTLFFLFLSYLSKYPEADCIYGDYHPGNNIAECNPAPGAAK
jgi:hypothetical protein